jgi:glycosyltransferase involved in cell wall biosynthesis
MTGEIFYHARQIGLPTPPRVIWLASWYPSRTSPYNGDFIQRHAAAVSGHIPILIIHTIHEATLPVPVQYEVSTNGALTEIIVYFRHDGVTSSVIQKIGYNARFNHYTFELLNFICSSYGLPALLHVHVPIKMGRIARRAKKKWGLPYIVSEQSSAYLPSAKDAYKNRSWLYRTSVKKIFREALAVTNVSYTVGKIMSGLFDRNDIRVIHNLADPAVFYFTEQPPRKIFRFIHVSTLKYQKNVRGIIDAMQQLCARRKDVELIVLGGDRGIGEEWPQGIEHAPWLLLKGAVAHDQVAAEMREANCLVLFSRDENFPCVIVEALCCGLPVVSSDAGGCSEAIDPSNGIVVKSEDNIALLHALEQVLECYDRYDQKAISLAAIRKYNARRIGQDFIDLYKEKGIL